MSKVPLEKMPLTDKPFKRVAIDLVGPISPPSEEGHRYILTLVDFSTRYPEAVPLKNIVTKTVAEVLVDILSCVGVPEEILRRSNRQNNICNNLAQTSWRSERITIDLGVF